MIEGMEAVRSRIGELQRLTGTPSSTGVLGTGVLGTAQPLTGTTSLAGADGSGNAFADVLAGLDGTSGTGSVAGAVRGDTNNRSSAALGQRVVSIAKKYLGVPYRWGGTNPATGLDCSGLTQLVYKQVGITLPRVSRDQAKVGREVSSVKQAKPGDLLFFESPVTHVGIYVGDGKILDAPHTGKDVSVRKIWKTPSHIRRVLPETTATPVHKASAATATTSGTLSGPYADLFTAAGKKYGVDPALLSAVAKAESGYRANAVSHAGAKGLMQLMPATAHGLGVNPLDPKQAVDGAARLLARHLHSYGGRVDLALAAYNAGPGAVKKYGGVPPYAETKTYVQRVTRYWEALR